MERFLKDLRRSIRLSRRSPSLTAVVVLALGLGIGAATAIFSLVDAVFFTRLPGTVKSDSLVSIWRTTAGQGFDTFSYPNYESLKEETTTFSNVAAYHSLFLSVSQNGQARRVDGALVTGNYFGTLGVHAFLGRTLEPADDKAGVTPVVVLSYSLWRQMGAPSALIGNNILVNARPVTVVGVAAEEFAGANLSEKIDVWLPLSLQPLAMPGFPTSTASDPNGNRMFLNRRASWLLVFARLKPGTSFDRVAAEINVVMQRLRTAFPEANEQTGAVLFNRVGLDPDNRSDWLNFCGFLMGAVALLLLLSCANLGNFALIRAAARSQQTAVCLALGAPRLRIVREVLMESIFLAALGGIAGFFLSFILVRSLAGFLPESNQLSLDAYSSFHAFLFMVGLAALTGALFGLLPAWKLSKTGLSSLVRNSSYQAGSKAHGTQQTLVVVQVALSLVLLIGAGLLAQTLRRYSQVNLGFDSHGLTLFTVSPAMQSYTEERTYRFEQELFDSLNAIPGVTAASLSRVPPLSSGGWGTNIRIPGRKKSSLQYNVVAPHYFRDMGIPQHLGRDFLPEDNSSADRVIILNDAAAQLLWPGENPLGKQLMVGEETSPRDVIGVVRDSKYRQLLERPRPLMYLPMWQPHPLPASQITIQVRASRSLASVSRSVEQAVHGIDPDLPVFDGRTMNEQVHRSIWQQRLAALIITSFAALALVLGLLGVYGIMAYSVRERTQEIGIRMALGAGRGSVLRLILSQGFKLAATGIALGSLAALVLTPALVSYLYGISPRDPLTMIAVALALLATVLTASYFPAYWATKVEPTTALRYE